MQSRALVWIDLSKELGRCGAPLRKSFQPCQPSPWSHNADKASAPADLPRRAPSHLRVRSEEEWRQAPAHRGRGHARSSSAHHQQKKPRAPATEEFMLAADVAPRSEAKPVGVGAHCGELTPALAVAWPDCCSWVRMPLTLPSKSHAYWGSLHCWQKPAKSPSFCARLSRHWFRARAGSRLSLRSVARSLGRQCAGSFSLGIRER
jgi:hypothetical protein